MLLVITALNGFEINSWMEQHYDTPRLTVLILGVPPLRLRVESIRWNGYSTVNSTDNSN